MAIAWLCEQTSRFLSVLLTGAVVAGASFGCTSRSNSVSQHQRSINDPLAAVPDDLIIDLRVLAADTPSADENQPADQPVIQPARFVLMPDGSLHGELDGPHEQRALPAEVRRLDRHQLSEIWSLINELGFGEADVDQATPMLNPLLIDRPAQGALYVLNIRSHDHWWQVHRSIADVAHDDPAMAKLAAYLSDLCWLDDTAERAALVAPRRYDFGPDPYARYRDDS